MITLSCPGLSTAAPRVLLPAALSARVGRRCLQLENGNIHVLDVDALT
jgi:hypothetical protein